MRIFLLVKYSKGPTFLLQHYVNYKYRCPTTETVEKEEKNHK